MEINIVLCYLHNMSPEIGRFLRKGAKIALRSVPPALSLFLVDSAILPPISSANNINILRAENSDPVDTGRVALDQIAFLSPAVISNLRGDCRTIANEPARQNRNPNFNAEGLYADPTLAGQTLGEGSGATRFTNKGTMYTDVASIGSNMIGSIPECRTGGAPVGSAVMVDTDHNGTANGWQVVVPNSP